MNSEEDLFDYENSQNETYNIKRTTSVLKNIFGSTQKQAKTNANMVNVTTKCAINKLLNSKFNYKKFIYPSNEDIIKEMEDTKNPNVNCGKFILSGMSDDMYSQIDSELLRQLDIPMTLPDQSIEIQHEHISNSEIEIKTNENLYNNRNFEVDLDLSIKSEEIQGEVDLKSFKIDTRKRKSETFNHKFENEHIKEEHEVIIGTKTNRMACIGFKTGTGKQVSISKVAEQKAIELFEKIKENEIPIDQNQLENSNRIVCNPLSSIGAEFEININNKVSNINSTIMHEETSSRDQIQTFTAGFVTAAGRKIPQSKSAYNEARKLLDDIETNSTGNTFEPIELNSNFTEEICPSIEIQKNVNQSNKNKQYQFENDNENQLSFDKSTEFIGFKTAAGQTIPQSKSAYNQARKLLDDIEGNRTENLFESVEFNLDLTKAICPPTEIAQPFEIQTNSDQSNKSNLLQFENDNQSILEKNREFIGFKTDTDRVISVSESSKPVHKRTLEDLTNEINKKTLINSKTISHLNSVEDLELFRHENYKLQTRIFKHGNGVADFKLSKEQLLETDLIMKEVENMDCSWDRAELSDSWNTETTNMNDLSNLVQSPIANKTDQQKTHLLSSTPIRKMKSNSFLFHLTDSFSENFDFKSNPVTDRINASIKLQETTANKDTIEISSNAGRFSQLRTNRSQLFPIRELFRFKPSTCVSEDGGENIDFMSCINVRFCCDQSVVSLEVGDKGVIVPDDKGYIGLPQFIDSFMGLPNVDPKLISAEWIKNHYQMIMWKLLALDKRYRDYLANDWLSPHHIMLQLKYRYDKEIDNVKRPASRKICEQDDSASKRLVLVVVSIEKIENDAFKVLVSDGWYCVPAIFDKFLKDQIINKKIKPGTKLVTCNAIWTGCEEPIVLPVDHFPPGCGLKLHGNSTRRARSFAKLGYQSNLKPFPVALRSLNPNGGTASLINVVINRIYPLQYMETIFHPNQNLPQRIFRNERAEEFARKQFDQSKENIINTTLEKMISPAYTNRKRNNLGQKKQNKITDLCNGEDIMNWLNNSTDQESALTELSLNQQNMLRIYRENLVLDALQEKCPNRNVVTLLRILVGGCLEIDVNSKQVAILTIWKPNDDLMTLLVEGTSLKIYCIGVTHGKLDVQFSGTNPLIALNSVSTTRFERNKEIHENLIAKVYQSRQLLSIPNACQFLSNVPTACEIDCIGVVIAFSKVNLTSNDSWQHVVISDPDDIDNGIILVKFWGDLKGNFLTSVIETGNCVKFYNLQFRKSVYSKFNPTSRIPAFECHYSTYSNVVYVSRKWNFHVIKQSIVEKLEKCLPAFEIFTNDKYNSIKSFSSRTLSPLPIKNKLVKNKANSLNVSESSSSLSLNVTASTPKRLGLSSKRILKTTNSEKSSLNNETLKSSRIEESTVQTDIVQASNASNYNYIDQLSLDSTIAELVKVRKRNSTFNASYVSSKKK